MRMYFIRPFCSLRATKGVNDITLTRVRRNILSLKILKCSKNFSSFSVNNPHEKNSCISPVLKNPYKYYHPILLGRYRFNSSAAVSSVAVSSAKTAPESPSLPSDSCNTLEHNVSFDINLYKPSVEAAASSCISDTTVASNSDIFGWVAGYVKFLESVASSAPVLQLMSCLRGIHDSTGLPWWGTIILFTIVMRTAITLPLAIYQQVIVARLHALRDEMKTLTPSLVAATRTAQYQNGWDLPTASLHFKQQTHATWQSLVERDNCHPGKGVVMMLGQLPLWIMISLSLRNLTLARPFRDQVALTTYEQMTHEGFLWCSNLSVPDSTFILPITMVIVNLAITELNSLQRPQPESVGMKRVNNVFRAAAFIILPISIFMPSGVVVYWVTSSWCALVQSMLLLHPLLRSACSLPPHQYTYAEILSRFGDKFRSLPVVETPPVTDKFLEAEQESGAVTEKKPPPPIPNEHIKRELKFSLPKSKLDSKNKTDD